MLASADGTTLFNVVKGELPKRSGPLIDYVTVDVQRGQPGQSAPFNSNVPYSELSTALRLPKDVDEAETGYFLPRGPATTSYRTEYPVKVCPTTFATSILRGNSWTVQASGSQQQQQQTHLAPNRQRTSVTPTGLNPEATFSPKTGTQYGITASIARPSTHRGQAEKRWVDEDITHYGAIEENCGFDEWVERVDVSKFKQDISVDLLARPKPLKKERNPALVSPYPKPGWSYSNLIALALKNSETGQLTVAEIYAFMLEHFPYFRTAPNGWKNSVRHNLSLNKCFCKVELDEEISTFQQTRKSCLWMINPERLDKVEHDIRKWRERNPDSVLDGMARPEDLQAIEDGTKGLPAPRTSKHVLKSVHLDNRSRREMVYFNQTNERLRNEDAMAAEYYMPVVKTESVEDRLNCYPKAEEFMQTTFPSTETMLETSSCGTVKRFRSDSFYSPTKEIPVMELLPPAFVDAFIPNFLTPTKARRNDRDASVSPVSIESGFRHAHDALNDNSLLAAALDQSPYKMPVTFPVL
ncbi:unnamed protein product [Heligmosomoides polygyrus]|uniref:Fork-head domain-containing protein n=1 Tax=Heligmosomoides polygyrus TaxID=6339 RepID=A0A3P8ADQ1_HELPZ|nr:unnamed protein product [Heligmosomoides polygyrus]